MEIHINVASWLNLRGAILSMDSIRCANTQLWGDGVTQQSAHMGLFWRHTDNGWANTEQTQQIPWSVALKSQYGAFPHLQKEHLQKSIAARGKNKMENKMEKKKHTKLKLQQQPDENFSFVSQANLHRARRTDMKLGEWQLVVINVLLIVP